MILRRHANDVVNSWPFEIKMAMPPPPPTPGIMTPPSPGRSSAVPGRSGPLETTGGAVNTAEGRDTTGAEELGGGAETSGALSSGRTSAKRAARIDLARAARALGSVTG